MNLLVSLSLLLNIFSDLFLVAMKANRVDIVAVCPEFPAPKILLYFRMSQENLLGCDAFCHLCYFGRQHHRYGLDQEVDMILIGSNLHKVQVIGWCEFQADFLERFFHGFRKNLSSVLCGADQMVQHAIDIMPLSYVFSHT